jgi:hypothetical protein
MHFRKHFLSTIEMPKSTIDGLIKKELIGNKKTITVKQKVRLSYRLFQNHNTKECFNGFNLKK